MKVNRRALEGEDLDQDGWKMYRRICGRLRLRYGDGRQ